MSFQTQGQPLRYFLSIIDMLRGDKMEWNHIKCSIKTREGRKKTGATNLEQIRSRYESSYINKPFKYECCRSSHHGAVVNKSDWEP